MNYPQFIEEVTETLGGLLRDDIPVSDYVNCLYSSDPLSDFEYTGSHEIPSYYSKSGRPEDLTLNDGPISLGGAA